MQSLQHPLGLYVLFFTEMWERFSFYGMRAILVLYMVSETQAQNPGLGWDNSYALSIYGWYAMAVYMASVPGGYIADRYLGQKKTVMIGGLLLCLGHCILAIDAVWAFAVGISLIVLGVGGLKPNISTMVGGLYKDGDSRRDVGFIIFYMGINLGAFLSALIVGYVGETINWHYGFGLAGIGMILGQIVFIWGQKHLQGVGDLVASVQAVKEARQSLTKVEKDKLWIMVLCFLLNILFWSAYEQAGGLMNLYAMEKVNRDFNGFTVPASFFQSLNPLFIILLGTVVGAFWMRREKQGKESSSLFKMAIGIAVMGSGFALMAAAGWQALHAVDQKAAMFWLVGAYFLHTVGELCLSPVSLSFVTRLAPARYASLMMGLYFASAGIGDKFAGMIGSLAQGAGELQIFSGIFVTCSLIALCVILALKKLKALSHGVH